MKAAATFALLLGGIASGGEENVVVYSETLVLQAGESVSRSIPLDRTVRSALVRVSPSRGVKASIAVREGETHDLTAAAPGAPAELRLKPRAPTVWSLTIEPEPGHDLGLCTVTVLAEGPVALLSATRTATATAIGGARLAARLTGRLRQKPVVTARVTAPSGAVLKLRLFDDGRHDDGRAADGVYAARLGRFGEVGPHRVDFVAESPSAGGVEYLRRQCSTEVSVAGPLPTGVTAQVDEIDLGPVAVSGEASFRVEIAAGITALTLRPVITRFRSGTGSFTPADVRLPGQTEIAAGGRLRIGGRFRVAGAAPGDYEGALQMFSGAGKELLALPLKLNVYRPAVTLAAPAGGVSVIAGGGRIIRFSAELDRSSLPAGLDPSSTRVRARVTKAEAVDEAGRTAPLMQLVPIRPVFDVGGGSATPVRARLKTGPRAEAGEYRAALTLSVAGRDVTAQVPFTVRPEGLLLPEFTDFGDTRVSDRARASVDVRGRINRRVAIRARPGVLTGPRGAVIPAQLITAEPKSVGLGLGKQGTIKLTVDVPPGLPPGQYQGTLGLAGPGISGEVPMRLRLVETIISAEPGRVLLGRAHGGLALTGSFEISVSGVGESVIRLSMPGGIAKPLRPEISLPGDIVEFEPKIVTVSARRPASVELTVVTPEGAEDGEYEFTLIAKSRRAAADVPVVFAVLPAEPKPPFTSEPKELKLTGGMRRARSSGRIRLTSHSDLPLPVTVTMLKGDLAAASEISVVHEGRDLAESKVGVFELPPRSSAELDVHFRIHRPAEPGRTEMALILSTSGHSESVQLPVDVLAPPPRPEPGPFAGMLLPPEAALGLLVLIAGAVLIWAHHRRMGRFVGVSFACHAVLLLVAIPLWGAAEEPSGSGAPARAVAVQVMSQVEDYGVEFFAESPPAAYRPGLAGSLPDPAPLVRKALPEAEPSTRATILGPAAPTPTEITLRSKAVRDAIPPVESPGPRERVAPTAAEVISRPAIEEAELEPVEPTLFTEAAPEAPEATPERSSPLRAILGPPERAEGPAAEVRRPRPEDIRTAESPDEGIPEPAAPADGPEALSSDALPSAEFDQAGSASERPEPALPALSAIPQERAPRVADMDRDTSFGFDELGPVGRFSPEELKPLPVRPKMATAGDPDLPVVSAASPDRPAAAAREVVRPGAGPGDAATRAGEAAAADPPATAGSLPAVTASRRSGTPEEPRRRPRTEEAPPAAKPGKTELAISGHRRLAEAPPPKGAPVAESIGGESLAEVEAELPGTVAGAGDPAKGLQALTMARAAPAAGVPAMRTAPPARTDLSPAEGKGLARAFSEGDDDLSAVSGPSTGPVARVTSVIEAGGPQLLIGRVRHSGLWNASPGALFPLVDEFGRRYPNFQMELTNRSVTLDPDEISSFTILYITGRGKFTLTGSQTAALGDFLRGGGSLWADDASSLDDAGFDQSLRQAVRKALPGATFEHLHHRSHPIYRAGYDLRKPLGNYWLPPGGIFRVGFFEGVDIGSRTAVVYTRNAYGSGLVADPYAVGVGHPVKDISPRRRREGSVRVALNVLAFFLGGGSAAPSTRAGVGAAPASAADPEAPWRYTGPGLNAWEDFQARRAAFRAMGASVRLVDDGAGQRSLEMAVDGETAPRAAATRTVTLRLDSVRAVVLKVESRLARGADFALEFLTEDGSRYESAPVFLAPGTTWNLRVPLDREDFKSSRTRWTGYDSAFDRTSSVRAIGVVLYPGAQRGSIVIDDIRFERGN